MTGILNAMPQIWLEATPSLLIWGLLLLLLFILYLFIFYYLFIYLFIFLHKEKTI